MPRSSTNQQEKNQQERIEKQLADLLSKQLKQSAEGKRLVEEYKKDPNAAAEALNNFLRERLISDKDLAEKAVSALGGNTNRQRNAVGKDSQFETIITDSEIDQIFNIGSLNDLIVKRFFFQDKGQVAVFVLAPIFVLLIVISAIYYSYWNANQPVPGPNDSFNIVIAQIGQITDGELKATERTKAFTQILCNYVETEMSSTSFGLKVHVDHKHMPIISQDQDAQKLATDLNADLVVYGNVVVEGEISTFLPRFFVSTRTSDLEVGGYNQLSRPIEFKTDVSGGEDFRKILHLRAAIYVNYIRGLVYLNIEKRNAYASAYYFQLAVDKTEELADPFEGQEILYLMLAYSQKLDGRYEDALMNLEKALEINPDYARAYIGLGNVYYHYFVYVDHAASSLDQAWDYYQMALEARDRPATDYVSEKVDIGFGNIQAERIKTAPSIDLSLLSDASDKYQKVINRYMMLKEDPGLQRLAAYAYSGLGWVYNAQGEQEKALDVLKQCTLLPSDQALHDSCQGEIDRIRNGKTSN